MMGALCTRGLGLVATSLWRNIDAGLTNARRGNRDAAWHCLQTIVAIHREATSPAVRAVARSGYVRIKHALGRHQPANDRPETRHA